MSLMSCKQPMVYKLAVLGLSLGLSISALANDLSTTESLARQGRANAQTELAMRYLEGTDTKKNYTQAKYWLEQAAAQGDPAAQYNLGWMYMDGAGVQQDYSKAMAWYLKAANQGHAIAQYNIGWMFEDGMGVEQD